MSQRITFIDSIKFVLIVLVILGHALECNRDETLNMKAYIFIYSFHMPAFILLSGYFAKKHLGGGKSVVSLIITYLIFQVLYCGNPLEADANWPSWAGMQQNVKHLYLPSGALWYIVSLVFWRLMLAATPQRLVENVPLFFCVSLLLSLLAGFVPVGRELSFQRTFAFFPYFLIGYYMREKDWLTTLRNMNRKWYYGLILLYVIAIALIPHIPLSMLVQFHHYRELGSMPVALVMRCASYLWMLPLTQAVIATIPDVKWMSEAGKDSLFYYVYHAFLIGVLHLMSLYWHLPTDFMSILLYTTVIVCVLHLTSKVRLLKLLSKPF